ncbi:MAG TPA: DUF177 domain-containing protein [Gaiellaceae bacterium]|nr:DUF177 domain-containing protein [Gaiellaceae bacterium]
MTSFDLRRLKLRTGEQLNESLDVELDPLVLGGQEYAPDTPVPAELTITKANTGTLFELGFRAHVHGPCFRCLCDTSLELSVQGREYQATNPGGDEELNSPYVEANVLELSRWAQDALVLELPDKILHSPDCAGLCAVCGVDLNVEPHTHDELAADPRWAALEDLRGQL